MSNDENNNNKNKGEEIESGNHDASEVPCACNDCGESSNNGDNCCKDEKTHKDHCHHHPKDKVLLENEKTHKDHCHHHPNHHHHCLDVDHVKSLRVYLANLLVSKHAIYGIHWHVKGNGFLRLHKFTEEVYDFIIERYDVIAERIIQLGHLVPHNPCEQLKHRTIPHINFEFINPRDGWHLLKFYLRQLVKNVNDLHEHMSKCHYPKDNTTSIILDDDLTTLDKFLWLTKSSCPCNDLPTVIEPKLAEIYKEIKKHK